MQAVTFLLPHGPKLSGSAVTLGEVLAVLGTQRSNQRVRALLADLTGFSTARRRNPNKTFESPAQRDYRGSSFGVISQ